MTKKTIVIILIIVLLGSAISIGIGYKMVHYVFQHELEYYFDNHPIVME